MKILKNYISILVILLTVINVNAQKNDDLFTQGGTIIIDTTNPRNSTIPTLDDFRTNFPTLYKNLDTRFIQNAKGDRVTSLSELSRIVYFTLPAVKKGEVVGRLFSHNGNVQYLDLKNYKKVIDVSIVSGGGLSTFSAVTKLDTRKNVYTVNVQNRGWCEVSCAIGTIAIAASDGPSPLMDILAVAYAVSCLNDCAN